MRHQDDTLRIVPDDLWEAVHQRLDGIRQNYLRWTGGKLWGRPASGTESKYLLTGLGTCARCGGGVAVEQRTHGRRTRAHFYGCWAHRSRGPAPCTNGLLVPLAVADDGILSAFESQLLHRDAIALGLRATLAALQTPPEAGAGDIAAQELETVEAQLSNLTQAIKLGGSCPRW